MPYEYLADLLPSPLQAIELCAVHKVKITEDMAEKMTLPKPAEVSITLASPE